MRILFLVIIFFSFLCLFVLLQRRQATSRATSWKRNRIQSLHSLLGNNLRNARKVTLWERMKSFAESAFFNFAQVMNLNDKPAFIRNIIVMGSICAASGSLNTLFIGFPPYLFLLATALLVVPTYYAILSKSRRKKFNLEFSEALTTINGAVSSGRTFLQAMSDFSSTGTGALAKEFGMIGRRLNVGDSAEQVFLSSWRRYPYREYYFFIVAILLNIRGGGRLKEVLIKLQRSITSGVAMEKKMLSMTSEMRMATKITAAIPFVFLILIKFISPENFEFVLYDERGRILIYYLLGSEITGFLIIKILMRGG